MLATLLLVLLGAFFSVQPSQAEMCHRLAITVAPEAPSVNDEVEVTVSFLTASSSFNAEFSPLTRDVNTFSVNVDIQVPEVFALALGEETQTITLGRLQEGTYTFKVTICFWDFKIGKLLETATLERQFSVCSAPQSETLALLAALAKAYNSTPESQNWNPQTDLNHDGTITLKDLVILAKQHY